MRIRTAAIYLFFLVLSLHISITRSATKGMVSGYHDKAQVHKGKFVEIIKLDPVDLLVAVLVAVSEVMEMEPVVDAIKVAVEVVLTSVKALLAVLELV
ncbi:hypothetical protein ACHQM5_000713 [Ranunculus cassubicifolius]